MSHFLKKVRWFWNVKDLDVAMYDRVSGIKDPEVYSEENVKNLLDNFILKKIDKEILLKMKALDFGVGVGRIAKYSSEYFKEVVGLDISPNMIKFAKEHTKEKSNVSFNVYDGSIFPYNNETFDFVYTLHVLQHIPTLEMLKNTLLEIKRVLKNRGIASLHFNYKHSEVDREPGLFAGYRPTEENAVKMLVDLGFYIENTVKDSAGHFYIHVSK